MPSKIISLSFVFLLSVIVAHSQSHNDIELDYLGCDENISQPIKEDDGRILNRKWIAIWNGDGFHHLLGTNLTEGKDHDAPVMNYLTHDGGCWQTSWDAKTGEFVHKSLASGEIRRSDRIDYLTWDLTKWTAKRDGDEFVHTYKDAREFSHTWLATQWAKVRKTFSGLNGAQVYSPPGPSQSTPAGVSPRVGYPDPSWCIITPFSSSLYVTLYEEAKSGATGALIQHESMLSRGSERRVDAHGQRLVYDYRYSKTDTPTTNVHISCSGGKLITVP